MAANTVKLRAVDVCLVTHLRHTCAEVSQRRGTRFLIDTGAIWPVGQTGSAGGADPGDTDLLVADGLGPDLLRDFCQAGDRLPADLRVRVAQVEAKPMTSTASANHGARTVGLVTW